MTDLWPNDFGVSQVRPPVAILREQAEAIGTKTQGRIVGEVRTKRDGSSSGFAHDFFLIAPYLDDYTYRLLVVRHPLQLYPAQIIEESTDKAYPPCPHPDAFIEQLRAILGSAETKQVITAILAQTHAVMPSGRE